MNPGFFCFQRAKHWSAVSEMELATALGTGSMVGTLVGLTGIGGGALGMPALLLVFRRPAPIALGTDAVFSVITKAFAAWRHNRQRTVHWKTVSALFSGSLPAAAATLAGLGIAEGQSRTATLGHSLQRLTAVTLLILAALNLVTTLSSRLRFKTSSADLPLWALAALGVVLGALAALTSVGSGSLLCALLSLSARWPSARIVGTDLAHAVPLMLLCGSGHALMGHVDWPLALCLVLGSVPAVCLSSRATLRMPDKVLRLTIGVVLLACGAGVLR